jgi:prolyl-tRNA synthetase
LAVVTVAGGEQLAEPLVVRPTSETVIMQAFSDWVQSYRDLPLVAQPVGKCGALGNAHAPRSCVPLNFLWQEGHTAHATYEEAEAPLLSKCWMSALTLLSMESCHTRHQVGASPSANAFAGALKTYTIEAMMRERRGVAVWHVPQLGAKLRQGI